jgi:hypothetical protein
MLLLIHTPMIYDMIMIMGQRRREKAWPASGFPLFNRPLPKKMCRVNVVPLDQLFKPF